MQACSLIRSSCMHHSKQHLRPETFGVSLQQAAMAQIPASVEARVNELLQQSATGDKLVKTVDEILQLLRQSGLSTSMRLVPGVVGVHPRNRDGAGINSADVHDLLQSVMEVGFLQSRVHAVAIEVASDSERQWNQRLVDSCSGRLGVMQSDRLRALSLCASHTNFMLRIVADAAAHDGDSSITVDGKLDIDLVTKKDQALGEHVRLGLTWEVLAASVGQQWPQLLQLIQSAGNATLHKAESELQIVRKAFSMILEGSPEFAAIKKRALASRPPCSPSFPHLYLFALKPLGIYVYIDACRAI